MNEPLLAQETIDAFARDGFVVTENLLNAQEIEHYGAAVDAEVARRTAQDTRQLEDKSTYEQSFIQCMRLWETDPTVRELTFHQRLAQAASELLGVERLRLWQDQALYKEPGGRVTDAHQDQPFWPIEPAPLISAWIPFQRVEKRHGAMAYVPGSHLVGKLAVVDISHSSGEPRDILQDPALEGREPVWVEVDPGSVIWHNGFTVHQASANDTDSIRRTFTVVYLADGARRTKPWKLMPLDREGIQPGEVIAGRGLPIAWPRETDELPVPHAQLGSLTGPQH